MTVASTQQASSPNQAHDTNGFAHAGTASAGKHRSQGADGARHASTAADSGKHHASSGGHR
ncbi:hypothetical protein ACSMXN_24400 [Jatrophihabitans sp. DSM 45814]